MNTFTDPNNPAISEGDKIKGYEVRKISFLKETESLVYELEHPATGAKHIHISNRDTENTFGVILKTVPQDSTGVAHILEHTVLCGSKKFPAKDPFFSMLKRSLNTFMNAFTSSDWTMYPFATENKKDYYNLMDVYLDAVFFPNISELSFKQEGHRMEESKEKDGELEYKGVVYNEMKGAMSSPNQLLFRNLMKAIYPDTTYGNNSGGEPEDIPGLTHEQLVAFHGRHYHPSNAYFYTYGNLPLTESLTFIEKKVLAQFSRIDPKTDVPSQPRWNSPRESTSGYPFDKNEPSDKKSQVCMAWLMCDITDTFEVLSLILLTEVLLGNSASPLHKALIDSGLGSALSDGTGYDSDNRDTLFTCGLKDVSTEDTEKIKEIIISTLKNLAENGIDKELIDSAIHQVEFHKKEITNTPYPYGIKVLLSISGTWLHGGDPAEVLLLDNILSSIREKSQKGPYFESLIQKYLLGNKHSLTFSLVPDTEMAETEIERVKTELKEARKKLSGDDLEKINNDAETLKKLQESEEDLTFMPTLELSDIPPDIKTVKVSDYKSIASDCYRQPTSGIFYFTAAMGAGHINPSLFPYVSLFCSVFSRIGTTKRSYVELARLIDAHTGGVGMASHIRTTYDDKNRSLPLLILSGKCLERNRDRMFDITQELLASIDFSDHARLKNLLQEFRAGFESAVINNGHSFAMSLAARNLTTSSSINETWKGIHQLRFIKDLTDNLTTEKLEETSEKLKQIANTVLSKDNFKTAIIGSDEELTASKGRIDQFSEILAPAAGSSFVSPPPSENRERIHEGWHTTSSVSFVAESFKTVRKNHPDAACLSVISKLVRSMYLHREIREKGGAYGGFSIYNPEEGVFSYGSYRDPHITRTLDVYKGVPEFLKSGNIGDEDVKEAILQVCSGIDKPDTPGPAARKAFLRKLIGLTDEDRKKFKESLLRVSKKQVEEVTEKYFTAGGDSSIAVVSGEEKLLEANEKLERPLTLHKI